jgi:hypothetical protein
LAWSIGWEGLMVATSKDGLVWENAPIAVSARQIVTFLNFCRMPLCVPFFFKAGRDRASLLFIIALHPVQLLDFVVEFSRSPLVQSPDSDKNQHPTMIEPISAH